MSRRRPIITIAVLLVVTAAAVLLRIAVPHAAPTPRPTPTASSTTATPDPLVWYRSLPTPSCPTDPELLRDFYRQGQCPQGARK